MKVKDLIKYLTQKEINRNATVWLLDRSIDYDFTGINTDDNGDVSLYVIGGDKEA